MWGGGVTRWQSFRYSQNCVGLVSYCFALLFLTLFNLFTLLAWVFGVCFDFQVRYRKKRRGMGESGYLRGFFCQFCSRFL